VNDGSISGGDSGVAPPILDQAVLWTTTPCGSPGYISDLDEGVGVCTQVTPNQYHLFSWNSQNQGSGDAGASTMLELGFVPDQVLKGSNGKYFITHYGASSTLPPGLAVVDPSGAMQDQLPFTQVVLGAPLANSKGDMVIQIDPTFPKGMAQVGNRLFIATSNFVIDGIVREATPDGGTTLILNTHFNPGTVLIFNTASDSWEHYLTSTDFNPTSVAAINGKIYVVNTGDVNPTRSPIATTPSSIDVINPQTLQIERNIPLGIPGYRNADAGSPNGMDASMEGGISTDAGVAGPRENLAAGIQGEIAVSSDGKTLVLPTGDNSGRLIVVEVASGSSRSITVATGTKVLLTGVTFHPSDQFVYVGNFNDGKIYTVDIRNGQVVNHQTLDNNTTDLMGISDGLWQSASVFMGVGPQVYRLSVNP
jgi:hypothetical protein